MRHCTLKLNLIRLAVSLALFHVSFQIQGFSMYSNEELQHHAYFINHPSSVLSVPPSNILSSSLSTSLRCAFNCLQTSFCLSYNFGIHTKLCQLLATDKYNSSEIFEPSQEFDHHSIATPCDYQPCLHLGRCQPIYASNEFVCVSPVIRYYLGAPLQGCGHICESHHLRCVKTGGFPTGNAVDIFKELGIVCKSTEDYWTTDQPCYSKAQEKCYGATSIPGEINCEVADNPDVARLCPCQ